MGNLVYLKLTTYFYHFAAQTLAYHDNFRFNSHQELVPWILWWSLWNRHVEKSLNHIFSQARVSGMTRYFVGLTWKPDKIEACYVLVWVSIIFAKFSCMVPFFLSKLAMKCSAGYHLHRFRFCRSSICLTNRNVCRLFFLFSFRSRLPWFFFEDISLYMHFSCHCNIDIFI